MEMARLASYAPNVRQEAERARSHGGEWGMPKRKTHLVGLVIGAIAASVVAGPLGFLVFCGFALLALAIGRPKSSA